MNIRNYDVEGLGKKAPEFVMVDEKTQKGYLTFYDIDEWAADAIIAAVAIILRNRRQISGDQA